MTDAAVEREAIEVAEAAFHDRWAASVDVDAIRVDELFCTGSCPENRQILKWMGDIKGKRVLEVGCGLGEASVYFAKQGADVTASDISAGMLDVTGRLASRHGVKVKTVQVSANHMSAIPDNTFDIIYASNLLHHVEVVSFIREIKKKVRAGGSLFFWDPIHYNPIIQVYRRMATAVRTEDEHPLKRADLKMMQSEFASCRVRFFWYSALAIFIKFYLIDGIHPNQARYWKKIIDDAGRIGPVLDVLHGIDRVLFSWIPGIRWLGWNVAIQARVGDAVS